MKPRIRKSFYAPKLFVKFLAVFLPILAGVAWLGLSHIEKSVESSARAHMTTRIGGELAHAVSGLEKLPENLQGLDLGDISDHYLQPLLLDAAILCAEFKLKSTGSLLFSAPRKVGCAGQESYEHLSIPFAAAGGSTLSIRISDAEVVQAQKSYGKYALWIVLVGLALAALGSFFSFNILVGRRLGKLKDAIERFEHTGEPVQLDPGGRDELQGVMLASNQMQRYLAAERDRVAQQAKKLQTEKETVERLNYVTSNFLSSMSHQLRTPLTAIIGFSELLKEAGCGPLGHHTYEDYNDHILSAGRQMRALADGVLEYSQISAGKYNALPACLKVSDLLGIVSVSVSSLAKSRDVSVIVDCAPGVQYLWADERIVSRLLMQLLANAIKHSPEQQQVTLAARATPGATEISVRDTGVGMSADELEIAMLPFGVVDNSLGRDNEGPGLGLPLAKQYCEVMGGELKVHSIPQIGTTVTCIIPNLQAPRVPDVETKATDTQLNRVA